MTDELRTFAAPPAGDAAAAHPAAESGASGPDDPPAPPLTSDARVDAALAQLAAAVRAPVGDQVPAFADVHRALHDRLVDLAG